MRRQALGLTTFLAAFGRRAAGLPLHAAVSV